MLDVKYRWMVERDFKEIEDIEQTLYPGFGFTIQDLKKICNKKNTEEMIIGYVATINTYIVGYLIYKLSKSTVHIIRLAVDPMYQQEGIGSALLLRAKQKLSSDNTKILIYALDDNLISHLFLQKNGFKAILIEKNIANDKDGYLFEYVIPKLT